MSAFAESKKNWILGPRSSQAVTRLWKRYQSLCASEDLQRALDQESFRRLRLASLGVPASAMSDLTQQSLSSLITDPKILSIIDNHLKDEHGKPLQKIITSDINSRVLIEVEQSFSEAHELTNSAIELLDCVSPHQSELLRQMISWIVPIYHEKYNRPFRRGFSHMQLIGVIFTSFVERKSQARDMRRTVLAIDLAHELGHQVLMLYQLADKIMESPLDGPVYSSVRKSDRPAIMALHACVAAAYMMEACMAIVESLITRDIEKQFAFNSLVELCHHQRLGMDSLKIVSRFTQVGSLIVSELDEQLCSIERKVSALQTDGDDSLSYFGLLAP